MGQVLESARVPRDIIRAMSGFLGRLALAAAFLAAVASLSLDSAAGASRAETLYLAKMAMLVAVSVAALSPRRWGGLATAAVLVLAALIVVPPGPARPVLVMAGLAGLFSLTALARLRELSMHGEEGWHRSAATSFALAFGTQVLLRPEVGLGSLAASGGWVDLLLAPTLAAVGIIALATTTSLPLAGALGALVAAAGPGWTPRSLLLIVALVAGTWLLARTRFALPGWTRSLLTVLAVPTFLGCSILAAYPWVREAPLASAARLLASGLVVSPALVLLEGSEVALDVPRETVGADLADLPATRIVIDSRLANAALLPAGTVVATFHLRDAEGREYELPLRAGLETGEWAARRADVASLPGFAAPDAHRVEIEPGGAFFGSTYRSLWTLPAPVTARHIEVSRAESVPANLVIAISRVEIRP